MLNWTVLNCSKVGRWECGVVVHSSVILSVGKTCTYMYKSFRVVICRYFFEEGRPGVPDQIVRRINGYKVICDII